MKALLFALALFASQAQAFTVGAHLVSRHAEDTYKYHWSDGTTTQEPYNNTNPGLYVIHDGWIAGFYKNSYFKTTVYAGYQLDGPRFGPLRTAVVGALATGYEEIFGVGKLRPMILPSLILETPVVDIRYTAGPHKGGGLFQHVSIERRF